jgi:hypothetical protein
MDRRRLRLTALVRVIVPRLDGATGARSHPRTALPAAAGHNSGMAVSPRADHRARIDGRQFERFVTAVLAELGAKLDGFRVEEHNS